jgi:ABC-type uncharacterized transport system ATPase component
VVLAIANQSNPKCSAKTRPSPKLTIATNLHSAQKRGRDFALASFDKAEFAARNQHALWVRQ